MVDDLDRCCVGLILLSMGCQRIDTRAPTSKLMIALLGAIAEFERGLLLERQREGLGRQRQTGMYKGRKPMVRAKATEVIKLSAERLQGAERLRGAETCPARRDSVWRRSIECWPTPRRSAQARSRRDRAGCCNFGHTAR
jgi:DNA invertase Pin-like site-specific DNA recombinase